MLYGSYLFKCRFMDEVHFRSWPGYELLRIFIPALKKVVCATKEKRCSSCTINRRCLYPSFAKKNRWERRSDEVTLPFVIEPPGTSNTLFLKESPFAIKLILFGKANESFTHFVKVVEEMGYMGVGRSPNGEKAHFAVVDVQWESIPSTDILAGDNTEENIWIDLKKELLHSLQHTRETSFNRVTVSFRTPLFTKELVGKELPFETLIALILKRIISLFKTFGTGEIRLDPANLRTAARRAFIISSDLQFVYEYTDKRKERAIVGEITYGHVPALLIPLLECGAKIHIGDYTHIGMGNVQLLGRD